MSAVDCHESDSFASFAEIINNSYLESRSPFAYIMLLSCKKNKTWVLT